MTLTQFNATRWGAGMMALYDGEVYHVAQVDFREALVGLTDTDAEDGYLWWARCENVELVSEHIWQHNHQ